MTELGTLQTLVEKLPRWGERPALGVRGEFGARWWSYRRLHVEAVRVAALLADRGIGHGDPVLLWAINTLEWAAVLLGAALRGAIVVPVDADASPAYAGRLLAATDARLLFHGAEQDVSSLDVPAVALNSLSEYEVSARCADVRVSVAPEDIALVQFTSGTTGEPQGVTLSHRNVMAQVAKFERWQWITRFFSVRALVLSPLSHVQGLMLGICVPLWIGVGVLYSTAVDPPHIMRTVRAARIHILVAVPRLQHMLAEAIQRTPYRSSGQTLAEKARTIRLFTRRRYFWYAQTRKLFGRCFWVIIVGGASLPVGDERFWFESLYVLAHGYGLTETAAIVSFHLNLPFRRPSRAIGPMPADRSLRIAEDGELLIRGDTVTPGLFGNGSGSGSSDGLSVDADGYLHTGDLVEQGAAGRLHFVGRKKETIVTGEGFNVQPAQVEAALLRQPLVRDAVVLGVEQALSEEIHAVLLLDEPGDATAIVQQANADLEPHERIHSWSVWPHADFPRTALFKVQRRAVEAAVREKAFGHSESSLPPALQTAEPAPTLQTILDTGDRRQRLAHIVRYITETPPEQLRSVHARPAADLGLSSLDLIELLFLLEQKTGARLDNAIVHDNTSFAQLQEFVTGGDEGDQGGSGEAVAAGVETPHLYRRKSLLANRSSLRLLHRVLTPLVIPPWFHLHARLRVHGQQHLTRVNGPIIVAASHHRHGLDVMAIYCALPPHLRCDLLVVTANETFRAYLEEGSARTLRHRLSTGWLYHVGIPLFFPMSLWPHFGITRQGLMETCALVERGLSPLIFPEHVSAAPDDPIQPGLGWVATQTGTPVLPMRLSGNDGLDTRSRRRNRTVTVSIAPLIPVAPGDSVDQVTTTVQKAFRELA